MKRATVSILVAVTLLAAAAVAHAAPLAVSEVTASSSQRGNPPGNTIDDNLATRWAADGLEEWISYKLATCATVSAIRIAFYQGNVRLSWFDIETSLDGVTWNFIWGGNSTGMTLGLDRIELQDVHACYVRVVGLGNDSPVPGASTWTSITELRILGVEDEPPDDQFPAPTIEVNLDLLRQFCEPLLHQQ